MTSQAPASPAFPHGKRELTPEFAAAAATASKPKRKPNVTPRSFRRFFTPRVAHPRNKKAAYGRYALADITSSSGNRASRGAKQIPSHHSSYCRFDDDNEGERRPKDGTLESESYSLSRGRKRPFQSRDPAIESSSPLKRVRGAERDVESESTSTVDGECDLLRRRVLNLPSPIVRSKTRSSVGSFLRREHHLPSGIPHDSPKDYYPNLRLETSDFCSQPLDIHICKNVTAQATSLALPFCSAACNTNTLVAVGDEEGGVRLLETDETRKPAFSKAYLTFRPHTNAILDLNFSADDLLLATASGDQTAQIIDMPTQRPTHTLSGHFSSVKQVRFQPGSCGTVIATSSRDGSIQIWDLRCKGIDRSVPELKVALGYSETQADRASSSNSTALYAARVNYIQEAHASAGIDNILAFPSIRPIVQKKPAVPSRNEVSVTSLSFVSASNPHLLLTGSEANATVKLWDLRARGSSRQKKSLPLAATSQPESHGLHRQFGLTSIALSGDGARLYTLCKDHTVYTYSMAHLILGSSLGDIDNIRARRLPDERMGLGPIYGLRHEKLKVSTFYVKLALRPALNDRTEMIAVGSTESCAVVFSTDEPHPHNGSSRLKKPTALEMEGAVSMPRECSRPPLTRSNSGAAFNQRLNDTIPIYDSGSALVRGHEKEVTGMAWTSKGELVTVGDDMRCRVWRQDAGAARDLRVRGESGGGRWAQGWADDEDE